eukprot:359161-Chlamydomonas_euryale.AAC.2
MALEQRERDEPRRRRASHRRSRCALDAGNLHRDELLKLRVADAVAQQHDDRRKRAAVGGGVRGQQPRRGGLHAVDDLAAWAVLHRDLGHVARRRGVDARDDRGDAGLVLAVVVDVNAPKGDTLARGAQRLRDPCARCVALVGDRKVGAAKLRVDLEDEVLAVRLRARACVCVARACGAGWRITRAWA